VDRGKVGATDDGEAPEADMGTDMAELRVMRQQIGERMDGGTDALA